MKKTVIKTISLVLVMAFCLAPIALAATLASDYIKRCTIWGTSAGNGTVSFSFSITGNEKMTEISATKIEVKNSSGVTVKTFRYTIEDYAFMMGRNKNIHSGTVTYQGVSGNQYYAIAYFKVANSSGGDTDTATSFYVTA